MSLHYVDERNEHILNRTYNVEYRLGNDKICTFSNILVNVDSKYFWFDSPEDGMDIIEQDSVRTMICLDKINSIVNKKRILSGFERR